MEGHCEEGGSRNAEDTHEVDDLQPRRLKLHSTVSDVVQGQTMHAVGSAVMLARVPWYVDRRIDELQATNK